MIHVASVEVGHWLLALGVDSVWAHSPVCLLGEFPKRVGALQELGQGREWNLTFAQVV